MKIVFYHYKGLKNQIKKGGVHNPLTKVIELDGTLKQPTSLSNVVVTIEYDKTPNFNYVYIEEFSRYYFITNIVSVRNNVWQITMHVDVLYTYNTIIDESYAFIERAEQQHNPMIVDNKRVFESGYQIEKNEISNDVFRTFTMTPSDDDFVYVITGFDFFSRIDE